MNWTQADIDKLVATGKARVVGHKPVEKKEKQSRSKYNSQRVKDEEGFEYDSRKERKRASQLKILLRAGEIQFLAKQVQFSLFGGKNGGYVATYKADFVYRDNVTGEIIVEDVKSEATRKLAVYRLKRKLMMVNYNIKIKEV